MMEPNVILLEDDAGLRSLLIRGLGEAGFTVTAAATAGELLRRIDELDANAIIVDIGLPDADGRDVVQALRARGVQAPVIFLTARDALPDRVSGFAAGGDDYLVKPFALVELVGSLARPDQARWLRSRNRGRSAPSGSCRARGLVLWHECLPDSD